MSNFNIAGGRRGGFLLLRFLLPVLLLFAVWQSGVLRMGKRTATAVLVRGDEAQAQGTETMAAAQDTADAQGGGGGGGEEGGTSLWVDAWASGDGPTLSKAEIDERCAGTKANWCRGYFLQPPIPAKPPPRGNKTCLWGCNFVGVCDHYSGWCRCPAGWTGDHCSTRMRRPCSQVQRQVGSFEPHSAPLDYSLPGIVINSRCAQLCDEDIGYCFCNSTMKYGHELAPPDAPPGTPPTRRGRPLGFHCQPNKGPQGQGLPFGWGDKDPQDLWGPEGWCNADNPALKCPCILDGYAGENCDQYKEAFCANQCNGHGECNMGFCKCHEGWWGQDCAYRTNDTEWTPGYEDGDRPWTKQFVDTPASRDPEPGATRLRPLIYVYELPPIFNQVLLQYRVDHGSCVHRLFTDGNGTNWEDSGGYLAETGLHEALLQSKHRTLDPEEADYFYIPVYSSCYMYPIHGFADTPFFHAFHKIPRVHATTNMLIEVYHWLRAHHPYWDRSGGRDHIILQSHDEGSCWLPAVLRPATMLTHWGRMDLGHTSSTGYIDDVYSRPARHPIYMPEGTEGKLGDFPCYDPAKDLVVPPMTSPLKYELSPLVGAFTRNRTTLAFFKGRTQQNNKPYSRGIRQTLENLCRDKDWWGKFKIWIGEGNPPDMDRTYSQLLASSTFCFVLPGDGFSPRFEDAVQHGCLPVIIQDEVHLAFESIIDYRKFVVRIQQKDMERVPEILGAIPPEKVQTMQKALATVWRKWSYTGYRPYANVTLDLLEGYRRKVPEDQQPQSLPAPEREYDPLVGDALEVGNLLLVVLEDTIHARTARGRG
ncbi:hypothetical protein CHLNCDRAFT_52572 [Chlorella variabilis]|uniref:EGF-like domain-containing protein n=1 Tax=Chlorella variabilis TaxID=554065 RepID=E1ZFY0_CHLVA|nr:hypothetical protein CHLNCDRAFT_52572 [Chlorella variabilis]EFN55367.1 hypothetical protein CHLNCDRAFT_52572 [Chlorella variabilis]|eukprot:XP_005847469.1 hypothetical protein CHLNCDRAFT_52572 [Chlorella variabilis]